MEITGTSAGLDQPPCGSSLLLVEKHNPDPGTFVRARANADGLPYLALEYVKGRSLVACADAHQLGLRECLALFLQVLDAVQYAHGHHVIHRDLKPSNILVTESGQVRWLDFGVAKLLAEGEEGGATELTQHYGRALTPEYASPEQIRGEPLTAASDTYAWKSCSMSCSRGVDLIGPGPARRWRNSSRQS